MYKKGLGKIIHIKEDQADVFKIAENIVFFFLFTIDQSPKALIFVKGSFPDLKSFVYGSLSPFRKAFSQT